MPFHPTPHTLALALAGALLLPAGAQAQVSVGITFGPPPLMSYAQPYAPGEGYLWTPGYWAWNAPQRDYYWVPGTWVLAPSPGALWTPGWWGFDSGSYFWHLGYWGDHVGYYGGINYGYGYNGWGYDGGRWAGNVFSYNRAVNNINTTVVHNVYNQRMPANYRGNQPRRISYNGGPGGVSTRPTSAERVEQGVSHTDATAHQAEHERAALSSPAQRANAGRDGARIAATPRPSGFAEPGAVRARNEAARPAPQQGGAPAPQTARAAQVRPTAPMGPVMQPVPQAAPAMHQQPAARGGDTQVRNAAPANQPAQAQTQPRQTQAQPRQAQAEREQPRPQNEGRGQGRQRD